MADITNEDLRLLTETIQELNRSLVGRGGGDRRAQSGNKAASDAAAKKITATKAATRAINDQIVGWTNQSKALRDAKNSLRDLDDGASALTKTIVGAGAAVLSLTYGLLKNLPKTIDAYRDLMEVGQDFGGSMLNMNRMAAESRLSLEDFSKAVKGNSKVIASVGIKSFRDMSVGVRDSLDQFGMLGMTTDQLNGYLGSYMETQRLYGHAERMNQQQTIDSTRDLVTNITKFSNLTGKSRDEILKATEASMRDASLAAYASQLSGKASEDLTKNLGKAAAYLAALPGESGALLSSMLSQAVARESAWLTDQADRLASVGLGGVNDMISVMADKVKKGGMTDADLDAFRAKAAKLGKENMESLRLQTMSSNGTTKANAEFAIKMINDMSSLSKKKVEEIKKQSEITNTLLRLQETWSKVTSFIREQFFTGLGGAIAGFEESLKSPEFAKFKQQIVGYGAAFAQWLKAAANDQMWTKIGAAFTTVIDIVTFFGKVVGGIVSIVTTLTDKFTVMGTAIGALLAYLVVKKGASVIKDKLNEKFDLKADPFRKYSVGNSLRVFVQNQQGGGGMSSEGYDRRQKRQDRVARGRRMQGIRGAAGSAWNTTRNVATMPVGQAAQRVGYGAGYGAGRTGRALGTAGRAVGRGASAVGRGAMAGAKAVGRGVGRAAVGTANLARSVAPAIKGMAGGIGGLVLMGAGMALDNAEDFTGKSLAKLGLAAASGAATGAMFGPLGALVGGVVGAGLELMTNWDAIAEDFTKSISATVGYISKGFAWVSDGVSNFGNKLSSAWDGMKETVGSVYDGVLSYGSDIGKSVGDTLSAGLSASADWLKSNVASFSSQITDTWKEIQGFDWSGMFGTLGTGAMKMLSVANPVAGMAIGAVSKALDGINISTPTSKPPETVKMDNTITETKIKSLEDKLAATTRENADMRTLFNKLIETIERGNDQNRGGLMDMIEQQRRGNRGIEGISRNT